MTLKQIERELLRLIRSEGLANVGHADLCNATGIAPGSLSKVLGKQFHEYLLQVAQSTGVYGPAVPVRKARVHPDVMRAHLLTVALELAERSRFRSVGRGQLAEAAGTTRQNVQRFFQPKSALGDAIIREAIARRRVRVVAQGLVDRDPAMRSAPSDLIADVRAYIGRYTMAVPA